MRTYKIEPLAVKEMEACRLRIDNLTKPIYSLNQLEVMIERLAGIIKDKKPNHLNMGLVLFAADHAVNGPQNKTLGKESYKVLARMNEGKSATQAVLRSLKAELTMVDVGLEEATDNLEHVRSEKVMKGSHFFGMREAMSEVEVEQALEIGYKLAVEYHARGIQVVAIGNLGERAGLSALAITAAVTQYDLLTLMENNECSLTVEQKIKSLSATLARYHLEEATPYEILQAVGAPDICAMVGFILGAAEHHMAIVFDNNVTGAAAIMACHIEPQVKEYIYQSAVYEEPVHRAQMKWLERKAYLHYGFTIEEGLGAALGLSLIKASLHMLNDMKTFGEADVNVAEDGPGNKRQDMAVKDE